MTTAEVVEYLMVNGRTLGRLADRGELRKVKILTRVLWHRAEIEALREQMKMAGKGWVGLTEAATA
jgi:excisionase family DNA binding protein